MRKLNLLLGRALDWFAGDVSYSTVLYDRYGIGAFLWIDDAGEIYKARKLGMEWDASNVA